jgi:hypothetical protein
MGDRTHRALIAAAVLVFARALVAQNPPTAPARDTLVPELIFDDVFTPGNAIPSYVVLDEGVVYRVEIQPAEASVSLRVRRHPTLPPLFMVPLSREAAESQTGAYLVVPRASDEYRMDVTILGDEPVRVRIWRDPKESSRFARIRAEGFRPPPLAFALRAVYLASFRDAYSSRFDAAGGYHTGPQDAYGFEACLAVVPNGRILPDRVGGCALAFALWFRGAGRDFYTVGIAPEVVVRRSGTRGLSVSPQLYFGNTRGGRPTAEYVMVGAGARYTVSLPRYQALGYELEATILNVRSLSAAPDPRRVSTITLRLGAGFVLKL